MRLSDFGLLTDENVDPGVVRFLRGLGFDVFDVCENGLQGTTDTEIIRRAVADGRAVVTHDSDFGTLAIHGGEPIVGIVYLRPGHIQPRFTIETLEATLAAPYEFEPPFILVARRSGETVNIRLRHLDR